ncbi:hypothetical protein McanMca71_007197 [Microsporum canis]
MPSGDSREAAVLTRCTQTRSGKHYEVTKYEPDDSLNENGLSDKIISLTRCIETRSGKHHERPKRHMDETEMATEEGLMINGEPLLAGTEAFEIVNRARQLISAF